MPCGRIPGPLGHGSTFGCVYLPAPLGRPWFTPLVDFPHATPGPLGTNGDLGQQAAAAPAAPSQEDTDELKLLQAIYGVIDAKGKAFKKKEKKKWVADVDAYVRARDDYFGSAKAYTDYKATAVAELDADGGKLRNVIEPGAKTRKANPDWKKAQDVFYAWVRKAYEKKLGDGVDIPKLIKAGMSEKLQKALKQVRLDYGQEFSAGGFNPRPMKLNGLYRLGTLSEHATGTAIDIDASQNAQIKDTTWAAILKFTGKSLDKATRAAKWKSSPEDLHKQVKAVSDEFVTKLATALQDAEKAIKATAAASPPAAGAGPPAPKKDPYDVAADKDENLKAIGTTFLKRWKDGFLALEWALVKELHEEGFTWGATFGDPDLHHFEL
jgi:hypothetical protein